MSSKTKRFILFVLAAIVACALFVGCSGSDGSGNSGTGSLSGSGK